MSARAIHVMPDLSGVPQVDAFRRLHDRLYGHIEAHITLVFPFELPVSDDRIVSHCRWASSGVEPFTVQLQPLLRSHDDHLWLPVSDSAPLDELTHRLYSGPLSGLAGARRIRSFHITVARPPLPSQAEYDNLQRSLVLPVGIDIAAITLESIQPDETSLILGCFNLRP